MHAVQSCENEGVNHHKFDECQEIGEVNSLKRFLPMNEEYQKYDIIRKIPGSKFGDTNPSEMNKKSNKERLNAEKQSENNMSIIDEQSVVSSEIPVRQKFSHLLPPYMGAKFTLDQRYLIKMQTKIDEILDYLRVNRQKTKGQLFSVIRKSILEGSDICLEMEHFKQILFIKPDFYNFAERRQGQGKLDILISLPFQFDLKTRKNQFRKAIYEYVLKNNGFQGEKPLKIPTYQFSFSKKEDQTKKSLFKSFKQANSLTSSKLFNFNHRTFVSGIDPRMALIKGNTHNFEQMLKEKVKQNELRLKEEQQKATQIKYGSKEILMVFDEIPQIFKRRAKSSMFKSSIITDLDKTLTFSSQIITKILDHILEQHPAFFNRINNESGEILQVKKKFYMEVRNQILSKDEMNKEKENEKHIGEESSKKSGQIKQQKMVYNSSKTPSKVIKEDNEKTALKKQTEVFQNSVKDINKILIKSRAKRGTKRT